MESIGAGLPHFYPESGVAAQVVEDAQSASIPPLHKAVFAWAEKFTRRSWEMTSEDLQVLRDAGATEKDIVHWAQRACIQTWFVMMADGGGVGLDTKEETGPVVGYDRDWYHSAEVDLLAAAPGQGKAARERNGADSIAWVDTAESSEVFTESVANTEERYGFVPNLLRACSLMPRFMRSHVMGLELLEQPHSTTLPPRLHALVRGLVSNLNGCAYSAGTARALAENLGEGEAYDKLNDNWDPGAWPDQDRVVLEFAVKATRNAYKITAKDAQTFRDAGLTEEAYVDVLNTVAIQTSLDRLANCLGVVLDESPILKRVAVTE